MLKTLLVALLLVTVLSTQTIKNTEIKEQPKKVSILQPLSQPVYAAKEEMKPIVTTPAPKPAVAPVSQPPVSSGSHEDWMAQAGIPQSEYSCANALITKESGWRVNAQNPSSPAYGIPQSLPGEKMASAGADWRTNPITQLIWMKGYVANRYGGFCGAWQHSQQVNWY